MTALGKLVTKSDKNDKIDKNGAYTTVQQCFVNFDASILSMVTKSDKTIIYCCCYTGKVGDRKSVEIIKSDKNGAYF